MSEDAEATTASGSRDEPTQAYKFYADRYSQAVDYQLSLGRWIMAILVTINVGGLAGVLSAARDHPTLPTIAGLWLVLGLGSALMAGGVAWFGSMIVATWLGEALDHARGEIKPGKEIEPKVARASAYFVALLAAISLFAFVLAGVNAAHVIQADRPLAGQAHS